MKTDIMFQMDGVSWYLDLDVLMEWVSRTPNNERNVETQISDVYMPVSSVNINEEMTIDFPAEMTETPRREITETKNTRDELMSTARINLIMTMVSVLFGKVGTMNFGEIDIMKETSLSFKHQIAANTLIQLGILKKVQN